MMGCQGKRMLFHFIASWISWGREKQVLLLLQYPEESYKNNNSTTVDGMCDRPEADDESVIGNVFMFLS